MDATEKLQAFLTKLLIWNKIAGAVIVANFQMLEEVLYQQVKTQNSLSILRNLQTPGNTSELFQNVFYLDDINVEILISNPLLPD
jgi:hypothetical protein